MQATATHKFKMKKRARNEIFFLLAVLILWPVLFYFKILGINNLMWAMGITFFVLATFIILNKIGLRNSQLYARIENDNQTISVWMHTKSPVWMEKLSIVRNTFNKDEFNAVTTQKINKNETLVIHKKTSGSFYLPQRLGMQPAVKEFFLDLLKNKKIDKKYKDIMINFFDGGDSNTLVVKDKPKTISEMLKEDS